MKSNSEIISKMTGLLYPFIITFGVYIIINGHLTPGGGFQGGAILASVFISRYLVVPVDDIRIESLQFVEKVLFVCILLLPMLVIFSQWDWGISRAEYMEPFYLLVMNILIGLKVCCGLTVIFFRFVFHEGR